MAYILFRKVSREELEIIMDEIRWHGRGGQGAVTAAEMLAASAIRQNFYAQAFAAYGPERRGSPVQAFTRIDGKPVELRSFVYEPDFVVVLDPSLLNVVDVSSGLKKGGWIVANTQLTAEELRNKYPRMKVAYVDATSIALRNLGAPITNSAMIGALLKVYDRVKYESIEETVRTKLGEANMKAMRETHDATSLVEAQ